MSKLTLKKACDTIGIPVPEDFSGQMLMDTFLSAIGGYRALNDIYVLGSTPQGLCNVCNYRLSKIEEVWKRLDKFNVNSPFYRANELRDFNDLYYQLTKEIPVRDDLDDLIYKCIDKFHFKDGGLAQNACITSFSFNRKVLYYNGTKFSVRQQKPVKDGTFVEYGTYIDTDRLKEKQIEFSKARDDFAKKNPLVVFPDQYKELFSEPYLPPKIVSPSTTPTEELYKVQYVNYGLGTIPGYLLNGNPDVSC